jgi:hypothetical protein
MPACLLATELVRRASLDRNRRSNVFHTMLLRFAGCAATSHELAAALGGDDIVVRARGDLTDPAGRGVALRCGSRPRPGPAAVDRGWLWYLSAVPQPPASTQSS